MQEEEIIELQDSLVNPLPPLPAEDKLRYYMCCLGPDNVLDYITQSTKDSKPKVIVSVLLEVLLVVYPFKRQTLMLH